MNDQETADFADKQLNRVLCFFPRIEAKITILFAVATAMAAVLALNVRAADVDVWYLILLHVLSALGLGATFVFLYRASYPQLDGGQDSLIYFRSVAGKTEAKYVEAVRAAKSSKITDDLLGQAWRNAEILQLKFDSVKYAFVCICSTIPFWFGALMTAAIQHVGLVVK